MSRSTRLWTPLTTAMRGMALGYNYNMIKKPCFYGRKTESESKVHIPFAERSENMDLRRRYYADKVEEIFENHSTVICFHATYIPRDCYE